LDLNWA